MICQLLFWISLHNSHKSVQKQKVNAENHERNIRHNSCTQKHYNNDQSSDYLNKEKNIPYILVGDISYKHKLCYACAIELAERQKIYCGEKHIYSSNCI